MWSTVTICNIVARLIIGGEGEGGTYSYIPPTIVEANVYNTMTLTFKMY
jgi:hypothetical protein